MPIDFPNPSVTSSFSYVYGGITQFWEWGFKGGSGISAWIASGYGITGGGAGSQGFQGNDGDPGVGVVGSQGFQGFQGLQGFQGRQGFQGFQGITGPTGLQGFQGFQGRQGPTGVLGTITVVGVSYTNVSELVFDSDDGSVKFNSNFLNGVLALSITADLSSISQAGPQGRQGNQGPGGGDLDFGTITKPVSFTLDMGPISI